MTSFKSFGAGIFLVAGVSAIAIACKSGNSTTGTGGGCGALFDAFSNYEMMCDPNQPAIFTDRERFLQSCQNDLNAPNTSGYEAALDACASDINNLTPTCGQESATDCKAPTGTLAVGAACGVGAQCQSGYCKVAAASSGTGGGAPTSTNGCGTCAATVAAGQPCKSGTDRCADGSECVTSGTSSMGTCVAVTEVDIGGACADNSTICKSGATCDFTMKKCVALGDVGAACQFTSACKTPLVCNASKCATGKNAGDACTPPSGSSQFDECARGLTCDPKSMKCAAPTMVDAGGACDGALTVCKKGFCNVSFTQPSDGGIGMESGTCPTIIADGQTCDPTDSKAQCDSYADCIGGKCTIFDPATCK